ncbi:MAG: hypothetical protein K5896_05735, partial [Prevotella sp.]|nr:hypothetical protein [Prevotella sp.]
QRSGSKEVAAKKWQQRSGSKEVAAKKWQQRSGSKEVAAKKWQQRTLLTLQTPPLPLPVRAGFKRGVPHGVPAAVKEIAVVTICFSCFYLFLFVFSQSASRNKLTK